MLKQLWNELGRSLRLLSRNLGFSDKMKEARGTAAQYAGNVQAEYRQSPRSLKNWLLFAIVLAVVVACYGIFYMAHTSPSYARSFGLAVPVDGYKVRVAPITQTVGASGTALEYSSVKVMSRIMADVQKVPVNIGDIVTPKTLLIEADQTGYLATEQAAEQEELAARTTVDRDAAILEGTKQVKAKGLASEVEVQIALTNLATAKQLDAQAVGKLADAKLDLAFTRLKSPLPGNGIVLARNVNPGDRLAMSGALPIFTLGTLDRVYFVAQVQEEMSSIITPTTSADVVFSPFPSQTFHGTVEKVDPSVNDQTRTFPAYIVIDNPKLLLKPGVTGFARIKLERMALAVPDSAVMNLYGENASVFVVNQDSRAVLTSIRVGLHGDNSYEVLSGLKEGEVVVTAGTAYLKENERVHVNFPAAKS